MKIKYTTYTMLTMIMKKGKSSCNDKERGRASTMMKRMFFATFFHRPLPINTPILVMPRINILMGHTIRVYTSRSVSRMPIKRCWASPNSSSSYFHSCMYLLRVFINLLPVPFCKLAICRRQFCCAVLAARAAPAVSCKPVDSLRRG